MSRQTNKNNAFLVFIDFATRHLAWIAFFVYSSGFLIWNIYLSHFGFFEYNLVQVRFLSAGLLIWIPVAILLVVIRFLLENVLIRFKILRELVSYVAGILLVIWGFFLPIIAFPNIPQGFGGAKPIAVSIIGTPAQIDFLANFGVRPAENAKDKASVQTYPVCLIYQNDQYIVFFNTNNIATSTYKDGKLYIGVSQRVISLSREQFLGFQQASIYNDSVCGLSGLMYNGLMRVPVAAPLQWEPVSVLV